MREAGDGHPRGGPVAPRTAKHAPHMTAGEPDHVIFPISPQREKQQCTLPIISPAVAATSCGVRGGGGCLKLLVMRALERDENAAQGIAQDLSKLLRQRILKEFKNKYGGKGPDSLQDGKSVTFNALLEQGKKINITIDSAAFAAWPRTAGPDRPRATRARPAPPPGLAGPAPRVAHEHRSTHTYRRSARGRQAGRSHDCGSTSSPACDAVRPTRPTLTFTRVPSASAGPRFSPFRGDRSPAGGAHRHPAWCMEAPNDCSTKYGMKRTLFPWYVLRVPRQRVPTTSFFFRGHTRERCATSQSTATAAAF